jgi:nucleoside-diphosphate-sugar epimerase
MKNILITGAYGFVGTNIAMDLANRETYRSIALDVAEGRKGLYSAYHSWQDIDAIEWDRIHTVIHLAGKAHDVRKTDDPQSYYDINEGLTKIIYNRFLRSSAKTFIFFSSVKAAADSVGLNVLTEDVVPDPRTPYGRSKLQAERYILDHRPAPEKRVYILRPCMIHGPGNKGNLNLLFAMVQKGVPYPLGCFENLRSFTSIQNVAFIIRELIEKSVTPGIYNVCDDEPISTRELITMISNSCRRTPCILNVPKNVIHAVAIVGDILHIPLNSDRLNKLTESFIVSNAKLKAALAIDTMPISAKEGLTYTFNSFIHP